MGHNSRNEKLSHGCCCGHCHHSAHDSDVSRISYGRELLTLVMMIAGIVASHYGVFGRLADLLHLSAYAVEVAYYIVALAPVGVGIISASLAAWSKRDIFNEFTLMVLATIGAFLIGECSEGVAILLFYSFGEKLEESASDTVKGRITALLDKLPERVNMVDKDGQTVEVAPDQLLPGDEFLVKPGERVAVDSILCGDRNADFDTSAITGESLSRTIEPNTPVASGYISVDREVRLKATDRYVDSTMARIMAMVESSVSKKSSAETLLRRITRWYTPAVLAAAVLLFVVPWIVGVVSWTYVFDWHLWLERSLVLLVCSCPCALVVSIPLCYFVAIGEASRKGVLFKGSRYLDMLRRVDVILFDKTGTLTTGEFKVGKINVQPGVSESEVLEMAASVDSHSDHPLAMAVVAEAQARRLSVPESSDVVTLPHGMKGNVGSRVVLVGSKVMLETNGVSVPDGDDDVTSEVFVAVDGSLWGAIRLTDAIKNDVAKTISALRSSGVSQIGILSGDRSKAVESVAETVGADFYRASLLPADKHDIISELVEQGHKVAFVGDGINDAPSLAVADLGVAIGTGGSDVAMESADAVLTGNQLDNLAKAFSLSKKVKRVVVENVTFAIIVKLSVMVLGAFGIASLWAAVFADTGITLLTVMWTLVCLGISKK